MNPAKIAALAAQAGVEAGDAENLVSFTLGFADAASRLRHVVVLGASGSIGVAVVEALVARGADVIAGVRDPDAASAKNAPLVKAGARLVAGSFVLGSSRSESPSASRRDLAGG